MIYVLIWAHFVADFILQTDSMAKGKSSSNVWLGKHIAVYTTALCLMILPFTSPLAAVGFALTNGAAHFATDFITSRMTKKLWEQKRTHDFFVVIGADQAIHLSTLIFTAALWNI